MSTRPQSALITGASRGLGLSLMRLLALSGTRVMGVARHEAPLRAAVDAIRSEGGDAHALVADVADKEATYRIAGVAAATIGPIDLLVNNASTLGPTPLRLLLDTACEDLLRVMEVNLVGPFRLTKTIAGSMVLRGAGTILLVSSDAAVEAYPRWGAYSISKAALDHFGRVLGAELDGTGVRLLSIDPGEMNTAMHAAAIPEADPAHFVSPDVVAERIVETLFDPRPFQNGARLSAHAATPVTEAIP